MNADLDRVLREEAEHAEKHMDDEYEIGPDIKVTRPDRPRAKVLSVRMSPEEYAALTEAADAAGVPPSTLARGYILREMETPHVSPAELLHRIERLEKSVLSPSA